MSMAWVRAGIELARKIARRFPALRRLRYDLFNQDVFTGFHWHELMLADSVRVRAYHAGIARAVKPGDAVIDLGTGTGVLAHFAVQAGARTVHAIDHSEFIAVAAEIARRNDVHQIRFVEQNSRDFSPPGPVDLIIHEQMGHTLFDENMIENLVDLKRRALKPGGRIVPGRFELYAAPVSLKDEYRRPFLWEIEVPGIDLSFLANDAVAERYRTKEHRQRLLKGFEVRAFLAPPRRLLAFDVNAIASEAELPTVHEVEWEIDTPGSMDGICFHFSAAFDDGTTFDTSPFSRQTNWDNALIRTPQTEVKAGERIRRRLHLDPLIDWARWRVVER